MSTYDELLAGAKHQAELYRKETENFHGLAKDYIPQMCHALKEENKNLTEEDIRDRVVKDCLDIWGRATIEKHIPIEFKDPVNRSNRLGKKKDKEESVIQDNDSFPNKDIEQIEVTNTGEQTKSYANKPYEDLTEQDIDEAQKDFEEKLKEPLQDTFMIQTLKKQLQEKDSKIEELRQGITKSLLDKVNSRSQQEEIETLKKQLQEAKKMSESDIMIVELNFEKFSSFIKDLMLNEKPDDRYKKLILHINRKTGKMIKMDAE